MVSFFGDFFDKLGLKLQNLFVPTDEQWSQIEEEHKQLSDTVKAHIPFVGLFSEELEKAQEAVEKTDPLIIRIPSFDYSGSGGIGVSTGTKEINLTAVYEPYRAYIRGFLFLVVVALAFVYIVKYVLNYGVTDIGNNINVGNGRGEGD